MSTGELLEIEPQDLKFPFEFDKQLSCSLKLSNKTDNYVAFTVKTTNPRKYCVRQITGVVLPKSTCDVIVTMLEAPSDLECKDKFLVQCVAASHGSTSKDITPEMFNKESGNLIEECKMRVLYVPPPQPPPISEGFEEGSSLRASASENRNNSEFTAASRGSFEPQDNPLERHQHVPLVMDNTAYIGRQTYQADEDEIYRQINNLRACLGNPSRAPRARRAPEQDTYFEDTNERGIDETLKNEIMKVAKSFRTDVMLVVGSSLVTTLVEICKNRDLLWGFIAFASLYVGHSAFTHFRLVLAARKKLLRGGDVDQELPEKKCFANGQIRLMCSYIFLTMLIFVVLGLYKCERGEHGHIMECRRAWTYYGVQGCLGFIFLQESMDILWSAGMFRFHGKAEQF